MAYAIDDRLVELSSPESEAERDALKRCADAVERGEEPTAFDISLALRYLRGLVS